MKTDMFPDRYTIMKLSLATLVGMPLVALVIDHFSDTVDLATSLAGYVPIWRQILAGIVLGIVGAAIAHTVIAMPFMKKVNMKYSTMLGHFDLGWNEILFVSFCAGVGEELLFRGALQPLMGIPLTSVLFVAIHGYLNPKDWRISIYGISLTCVIAVIGFTAQVYGLIPAMIAHFLIDVWLLRLMQKSASETPVGTDFSPEDEN